MKEETKTRQNKKITIIIPAHNEENGIERVLDGIENNNLKRLGYDVCVLVINNNSTDKTKHIAERKGAQVIDEPTLGKGNALKTGFKMIDAKSSYVVMLDGDNTYLPSEIHRLIEPLESGFADVILGSRLGGHIKQGSMNSSHRLANWFFTFLIRHFYKANVTDVCTGFFAWKTPVVLTLRQEKLVSSGFAIETEMVIKMARMGFRIYSVPITYEPRKGTSKIAPVSDALRILATIVKNLTWRPRR